MARHSQGNALYNARFRFWDYGNSLNLESLPAIPYASNRWKVAASGGITGTITKGTGPSDIAIPKWMRSQTTMQINLTGIPAGANATIIQHVEDADQYGQTFAVISTVHSGPDGATIYVGIGADIAPVKLKGPGVLVTTTHTFMLGDFPTTSIPITVFSNPDKGGTYHIHYAQLALGLDRPRHSGFIVRPVHEDRMLCNRYAQRITAGISGPATTIRLGMAYQFKSEMRALPVLTAIAPSVNLVDVGSGTVTPVPSPALSISNVSLNGARMAITGLSGLPAASTQVVTTEIIGLLHADY